MIDRFELGPRSKVMEIASNDGYLLQHFVARGVPVLGIEPAANVAKVAIEKGVPHHCVFLRPRDGAARSRSEHGRPDLLLGNNVLAHVPDLNDFVGGMKILLAPDGVITMEFPASAAADGGEPVRHHLPRALQLLLVRARSSSIFALHGLTLFDVEELPTHGGSLRIYARHAENTALPSASACWRCASARSTTGS